MPVQPPVPATSDGLAEPGSSVGSRRSGDRYLDHARTIVAREPRMTHQPCVSSVATGSADARLAEPRASTG